jgi:hypothetical protein
LVERFFRDLTEDAVRDGSFASVAELVCDIEGYLAKRNLTPSVTSGKPPAATFSSKSTASAPPPVFPNIQYRHLQDITLVWRALAPHALHANIIVVDEPGRALLRRTDAVYR